ncbi:oligosaccharide flippase family protein [Cytophagaceae bacterium ABcell3]|nr:oligosaccharide flippase family protein [Cytophagaceae bacterium ABcell3]
MKMQAKATVLYSLLGFIPFVSSFVLLPVNVTYLSPADFGVLALAAIAQSYISLLLLFGMDGAINRFYFDHNETPEKTSEFLNTLLSVVLLKCTLMSAVLYFTGDWILRFFGEGKLPFEDYGWFLFFQAIFLSMNALLFQYYRVAQKLQNAVLVSLLPFVLSTAGGLIGVVYLKEGAWGSVAGKAVGTILASAPIYILLFLKSGFKLNFSVVKDVYLYSYPVVLYTLISNTSAAIDKIFLNQFFSLSELGIYNLAVTIAAPIGILLMGYWNAVTPNLMETYIGEEENKGAIIERYYNNVLLISFIAIWALIAVVNPVIFNFLKEGYWDSYLYIPLLAFAFIGRAYYIVYSFSLFYYKKTYLLPIINLVSLVLTAAAIYVLAQYLGIVGVCIGVGVSQFSQFLIAYYFDKEINAFKYPVKNTLLLLGMSFLIIFLNYVLIYEVVDIFWVNIIHVGEGVSMVLLAVFLIKGKVVVNSLRNGSFARASGADQIGL